MKTKHLYLILGFLGLVLPYSQFLPWILDNGLNVATLNRLIARMKSEIVGSEMLKGGTHQKEGASHL